MTINRLIKSTAEDARSRIRRSAIRLFAEKGFEGATTRAIADGARLNIATVHYHFGSKRALYDTVVNELYEEERAILARHLDALEAGVRQGAAAFVGALDALLDEFVAALEREPERARLYMRRWLEPREHLSEAELQMPLRLFGAVSDTLDRAQAAGLVRVGVDHRILLRSFIWQIYGYFVCGPIDWTALHGDPHDPAMLTAFREFRREFVRRMLVAPAGGEDDGDAPGEGAG